MPNSSNNQPTVQQLVNAIAVLLADPKLYQHVTVDDAGLNWIDRSEDEVPNAFDQKLETVQGLADEVLITPEGQPNYTNHGLLKQSGFNVFRGEYDSFGWLTGIIATPKGRILYG